MEKSPEIASGHNTSYFRELDARTGRWWSTDPVWQPWQSNYSTFDNNPIALADPSGAKATGGPGNGGGGEHGECLRYHAQEGKYKAQKAKQAKRAALKEAIGGALKSAAQAIANSYFDESAGRTQSDNEPPYEYDQTGKKISDLGGDKTHFYHQSNGDTKIVNAETGSENIIKGGADLIQGFTHREKDISPLTIVTEFDQGTGPTKSLIFDFDNSNIGPFKSLSNKFSTYASKARKAVLPSSEPRGSVTFSYFEVNPITAANDPWEQMWGRATVSWYKLGNKVVFILIDSKSMTSLAYRLLPSWERETFSLNGNTYQTYIWTESIEEVEAKKIESNLKNRMDLQEDLMKIDRSKW